MSSPWLRALTCLLFVGCSNNISGEWSVSSAQLSSDGALTNVSGLLIVEGDGSVEFDLESGDPDGNEFLIIDVEGVIVQTGEMEGTLDLTGSQEEYQNAIFIDLDLDCTFSETDASCAGDWASTGLDGRTFSAEFTAP